MLSIFSALSFYYISYKLLLSRLCWNLPNLLRNRCEMYMHSYYKISFDYFSDAFLKLHIEILLSTEFYFGESCYVDFFSGIGNLVINGESWLLFIYEPGDWIDLQYAWKGKEKSTGI